jgi:aspartyl-tRNA(Asn)/glutamyl-tRNA(Gln) amidotransferase subunit B
VANWIVGEVFRLLHDSGQEITQIKVRPEGLVGLLGLIAKGTINATVGKEVLTEMFASGEPAEAIVARKGLTQISDEAKLGEMVRQAIAQNPKAAQQFLEGKEAALGFLIGQVMRATRGQANAKIVERLLLEELARRK